MKLTREVVTKSVIILEMDEDDLRTIISWGGESDKDYDLYEELLKQTEKLGVSVE